MESAGNRRLNALQVTDMAWSEEGYSDATQFYRNFAWKMPTKTNTETSTAIDMYELKW